MMENSFHTNVHYKLQFTLLYLCAHASHCPATHTYVLPAGQLVARSLLCMHRGKAYAGGCACMHECGACVGMCTHVWEWCMCGASCPCGGGVASARGLTCMQGVWYCGGTHALHFGCLGTHARIHKHTFSTQARKGEPSSL